MDKKALIEEVKALQLSLGQYVVFRAGPMAAHGIRATQDIELLVIPGLYQQLKTDVW